MLKQYLTLLVLTTRVNNYTYTDGGVVCRWVGVHGYGGVFGWVSFGVFSKGVFLTLHSYKQQDRSVEFNNNLIILVNTGLIL